MVSSAIPMIEHQPTIHPKYWDKNRARLKYHKLVMYCSGNQAVGVTPSFHRTTHNKMRVANLSQLVRITTAWEGQLVRIIVLAGTVAMALRPRYGEKSQKIIMR